MALYGAGILAYEQGDVRGATSLLEESAACWQQANTPGSHALHDLGFCYLMLGAKPARVKAIWDEALARDREAGDERGEAWSLYFLGYLAGYTSDYRRARELIDAAVHMFRQLGDAWSLSQAVGYLGPILLVQGDIGSARPVLEEWLETARQLGNRWGVGTALCDLAFIVQSEGDLPGAERLFMESLRVFRDIGSGLTHDGLCDLGAVAVKQGAYARGVRLLAAGAVDRTDVHSRRVFTRAVKQAGWEADLATAKSVLDEERFASAWAEGQAMGPERATAYALREDDA